MSAIAPSLECVPGKYNAGLLFSQLPMDGSGDFTVTRTTTPTAGQSTRVNAAGLIELVADNVPRLDYPLGGITAGCPALLVEPSAQNIHTQSEAFASNYTTVLNLTPSGTNLTAPDNTSTADRFFETTANDVHIISIAPGFGFALTSGTVYTFSVFAQSIGGRNFRLNLTRGGSLDILYTLSGSGSVSNTSVATIQNYGNNWYRCTYTFTATSSVNFRQNIYSVNGTTNSFIGDVTKGFIIWGAQLETGSVATSYIPTTTAAITRGADVVSKTGVSSLIGQTEGTIYAEFVLSNLVGDRTVFEIGADNINRIRIRVNGSTISASAVFSGSTVGTVSFSSQPVGVYKLAYAYKQNDFQAYLNGNAGTPVASGNIPANMSIVGLGTRIISGGADFFNDRIRAAALYTTRLTDTQLALLTSPYTSYSSMASALSYTLG